MRTLIFLRHAEADPAPTDENRSISALGIVQAQHRGVTLEGKSFDLVITTKAKRTDQTASIICEHLHIQPKVISIDELYISPNHANLSVDEIFSKLEKILKEHNPSSALIVAHANIINELGLKFAPSHIELIEKHFRPTEGFEIKDQTVERYYLN